MRSKLTIFIPTYERPDFVRRQCAYWAGSGFKILILDGSAEPSVQSDVYGVDKNISYFHEPVSFRERLAKAAELFDTPYIAMLADDDLYFKAGLDECVSFLDQHDDFTTVFGRALAFSTGRYSRVISTRAYDGLRDYAVDSDHAIERLGYHMENYIPSLMYAVSRGESWRYAAAFQAERQFSFWAQAEVQLEMALSVLGKSKVLSVPLWLRSRESPSLGISNPFDEGLKISVPFNKFWFEEDHEDAKKLFLDIAVSHLGGFLDAEKGSERGIFSAACSSFANSLPPDFKKQQVLKNTLIQLQKLPLFGSVYLTARDFIKGQEYNLPNGVIHYLNCESQHFIDEALVIQNFVETSYKTKNDAW